MQAQNPDELSIIENEQLEVVGEGDGDGWLRARNYRGEEGYVPHNYLDVEREQVGAASIESMTDTIITNTNNLENCVEYVIILQDEIGIVTYSGYDICL